jgi:peptidoglycan/LPS O-acetylase OafA/YrhL
LAVIVFFVLSGVVLALPYVRGRGREYGPFMMKRFCRIYIPFLVTIVMAGALWWAIDPRSTDYIAPHGEWMLPVDLPLFLGHVFMVGLTGMSVLNPPMWSLIIEMKVSAFFPILVACVRKVSWFIVPLAGAVWYGAARMFVVFDGADNFYMADTVLGTFLLVAYYVSYFLVGILIAVKMEDLVRVMRAVPVWLHGVIVAGILGMPYGVLKAHFLVGEMWYGGVACYLILACIAFSKVDAFLCRAPLQWLGRVSYSLYLIHLPVLLAAVYGLHDYMPLWMILTLCVPVILVLSAAVHRWVEVPAMALGQRLVKR